MSWTFLDPLVFRTTGFVFDGVVPLGLQDTAAALDQLREAELHLADEASRWWQQTFASALAFAERREPRDKRQIRQLCAIRAALKRRQPVPEDWVADALEVDLIAEGRTQAQSWNARLVALAGARAEAEDRFKSEHANARTALWKAVADPAFQEAVFLSSPDAYDGLARALVHPEAENSKQRASERVAYNYLQRLCAKNDTTSFFGPVSYGTFADAAAQSISFDALQGRRWTARKVYLAQWVVAALAQRIVDDAVVFAELRPQRSALLTERGSGGYMHHGSGKAFDLPPALSELLQACDGALTVRSLAAALGPETPERLRQLMRLKLVDCTIPVVSTAVDALAALRSVVLAMAPEATRRALPLLDEARAHIDAFESQPWPQRRGAFLATESWLLGLALPARRKAGALYGDRLALYEDCAGPLQALRVGGSLRRRLDSAMPPVMEFLTRAAVLRRRDAQDAVARQLQGAGPWRYIDLVRELPTRHEPGPRELALHERLRCRMERDFGSGELQVPVEDLAQTWAPWRDETDRALSAFPLILPSPDVMVASRSLHAMDSGDFTLVLAELHDDCSTVFAGFFAEFHPDPQALRAQIEDRIRQRQGWTGLATVLGNRRSKHVTPELPGTTIRLAGVSAKHANDVVPISEVMVERMGDSLALTARGCSLSLYPGDVHSLAHLAFALPSVVPLDWAAILGRPTVPRITLGEVVVQRASWQLDVASMPRLPNGPLGVDGLRRMRQWLTGHGVPRWSFARWSANEKPLLVDACNPWALDLLQRLAREHPMVRLTEMYPDPSHLCFDAGNGRQTFELRLAMVREGVEEPARPVPPTATKVTT